MIKKYRILPYIVLIIIISNIIHAQNSSSIQINGGLVMPMSSTNGFNVSAQYNYNFKENVQFYIYSGYSAWDKFNVHFMEDLSSVQKQAIFGTYIYDNHVLIPVYIGSKINFHSNKLFTSFITFEAGYSHLSYNSYGIKKEVNKETGEVLSYYPDKSTRKKINENLFGLGVGIGLFHQLTENINIIISFKINSQLNSEYYNFLSSKGTYTAVNLSFSHSL